MQKRILALLLVAVLLLVACAKAPTWQEQYDLGMRYLSEGNYQEAVIAFAAAIAIDEKRPEAFISRGDAYMSLAATADDPMENLDLAAADYQAALALDATDPDVYERLADVYLQQGEVEKARETLQQGLDKTGDESLQARLDALTGRTEYDPQMPPDGQVSEGVVPFTSRANYRAFEDFTPEEQQMIAAIATAAMANDSDTLRSLTASAVSFEIPQYTIWGEYKICIYKHVYDEADDLIYDDGSRSYTNHTIDIEMRPQNGTGYCCRYGYFSVTTDEDMKLITCPCVDWQWNGAYMETYHSYHVVDDGVYLYNDSTTEGAMQACMCQGTFVTRGSQTGTGEMSQYDYTYSIEEVYQDGVKLDEKQYTDGELSYEWTEEDRQAVAGFAWGMNGSGWALNAMAGSNELWYW